MSATEMDVHRSNFALLEERHAAPAGAEWLGELRREAMGRFEALGYPTTRHEEWRYTNLSPLARLSLALPHEETAADVDVESLAVSGLSGPRLVFVDGRFRRDLSRCEELSGGATLLGLAEALVEPPSPAVGEALRSSLARVATFENEAFSALSTAFLSDGACLHVPRGVALDEPIQLVFLSGAGGDPVVSHPRVLVVAEEGSQASLVEIHGGTGDGPYFSNAVTEILLSERAHVGHVKVEREAADGFHVGNLSARLQRSATLRTGFVSLGGAIVRNDVDVALQGEGAECDLAGLYVGSGKRHADCHTFVDHAVPHCQSRQLYKGVLADHARGVFAGRVLVREDAQKTNAEQANRNLLLSETALADTKPQLEIHADDVKCSHGAAIGTLDPDAVFYLRARGLGEAEARGMLTRAFGGEVLDRLAVEAVANETGRLLDTWLSETTGTPVMEVLA